MGIRPRGLRLLSEPEERENVAFIKRQTAFSNLLFGSAYSPGLAILQKIEGNVLASNEKY